MSGGPQGREEEIAGLQRRVTALESELAAARKAAEAASEPLAAREALLASAEKRMHLGSWFFNVAAQEVKWSEELFHILGYDSTKVKSTVENYFAAIHPEDRDRVARDYETFLARGQMDFGEYRILRPDGTVRDVLVDTVIVRDDQGRMLRLVGSVLDMTERKRLEQQLRQSHKMEAVGRLAAGVAHDFNNLLSVIGGNVDLLQESRSDERLRRIREAAEVGAALTRQLLAFSRQSVIRPALLDLNEVVRDTTRIIERLIGEHIAIRLELAADGTTVLADRAQLQQILLNLCINARDAMPEGGEIRIASAAVALPPGQAEDPGAWVKLSVSDTGSGMDEATRSRAFEPFFTTKEPGKGTGLGLYAVQDAVAQAGGRITMDSTPGKGTVVAVLLPRKSPAPAAATRPSQEERGGGESILVVEDHPALRELVRCFLADAGYRVHVVGRPGEAEALWTREGGAIDLLITDLVMPEKSGRTLAAGLVGRKPSLKTLFISGYAQGMGPEKKVEGPYLQKPFTRVELLNMVRSIFDGPQNGADKATGQAKKGPAIQGAARIAGTPARGIL